MHLSSQYHSLPVRLMIASSSLFRCHKLEYSNENEEKHSSGFEYLAKAEAGILARSAVIDEPVATLGRFFFSSSSMLFMFI
jgi:hypothetical protein